MKTNIVKTPFGWACEVGLTELPVWTPCGTDTEIVKVFKDLNGNTFTYSLELEDGNYKPRKIEVSKRYILMPHQSEKRGRHSASNNKARARIERVRVGIIEKDDLPF